MEEEKTGSGRNILDILSDLNSGRFVDDATKQLQQIIKEVEKQGKSGALSLCLSIEPNADDTVTIKPTLKEKRPLPSRAPSVFFVDQHNKLHKNDPRQQALALDNVVAFEERKKIVEEI